MKWSNARLSPGVGGVGSDIDTYISCIKIQHGVQSEKEPLVYRLQYQETNSILKILCSSCLRVRGQGRSHWYGWSGFNRTTFSSRLRAWSPVSARMRNKAQ